MCNEGKRRRISLKNQNSKSDELAVSCSRVNPLLIVLRILCHLLLLQRIAGEHQLAQVAEPGLAAADRSNDIREWV